MALRRSRPAPTPWADDGEGLRIVEERIAREEAEQRARAVLRADLDEAARQLKVWAAGVARARQAEWHSYESATRLIAVELAREAIAVARARIRAGATVDQAVQHAIEVTEELAVDVVHRVGLQIEEWTPPPVKDEARTADRRRRIGRLRAKADSTDFPAEAASFRAKADELAARYCIDA